jgi:hypothetical protein
MNIRVCVNLSAICQPHPGSVHGLWMSVETADLAFQKRSVGIIFLIAQAFGDKCESKYRQQWHVRLKYRQQILSFRSEDSDSFLGI